MPSTVRIPGALAVIVLGLLGRGEAVGAVRVPSLVGSGMVLQRDSRIVVWGWAAADEKVRIRFQGKEFSARADGSGRWSTSMGPYAAGGPYKMSISGRNTIELNDILIGDVWLASGQSNMEMPLRAGPEWQGGVPNAHREIAAAHFPQLRLFTVERATASAPASDVRSEGWRRATPENVGAFSAVAYFFGREIHERYQLPIGLIQSVWGGTLAEAWTSQSGLKSFPEFREGMRSMQQIDSLKADYDLYVQRRAKWFQEHGSEDRGSLDGHAVWADPGFDVSKWPTVSIPLPENFCEKGLNYFGGVVWFRRILNVSPEHTGKAVVLHLGRIASSDATYFNGEKVGETKGYSEVRSYTVPARNVRAGTNVLAIRVVGFNVPDYGCAGLLDEGIPGAQVGNTALSLAGDWSYQPGTDLREFPVASTQVMARRLLPNLPTALFNGMIAPLVPYRIKGVIWYQGEANALEGRAIQYRALFPALIQDWRQHWGYDFPFLFVQLAGYGSNELEPAASPWVELQEAQSMALSVPRTGMASAVDLGDQGDIHPKNKQDVAHRLALAAIKVAYGENVVYSGPTYRSMRIEGEQIRIQFENLGSGLQIKDKYGYVRGFQIADAGGKYRWAQARQDGDDIVVFNDTVKQPTAVRYNWLNMPDGNVFNNEGLPAPPFRTDVCGNRLNIDRISVRSRPHPAEDCK